MEHLSRDTCWERLAASPVGRLAVVVDGDPEIFPVNFVVDGRSVVFRADEGSKLRGLRRDTVVCFEVDAIDVEQQTGWSIMVKGSADEVRGADDVRRVCELPLTYWALGDKVHFVRISPTQVTGREIHPRAPVRSPSTRPIGPLLRDEPLSGAPDALLLVDEDGVMVDANEMAVALFGIAAHDLIGQPVETLVPPERRDAHQLHRAAYNRDPTPRPMGRDVDLWAVRGDGTRIRVDISLGPMRNGHALAAVRDMTEQHELLTALEQSEARFRCIFESSPAPVVVVDSTLQFQDVNSAACELFGHDRETLLGIGLAEVTPAEDSTRYEHRLLDVLDDPSPTARLEKRFLDRDGRVIWAQIVAARLDGPGQPQLLVTLDDITERKHLEADLQHRALYDALTGLANRELTLERLAVAMARTTRGEVVGVIFIDLDHFKDVNDEHGHQAGDAVLIETARRILAGCRPYDTAGRLGGDEFVLVLDGLGPNKDSAVATTQRVAERIRSAMRQPIELPTGSRTSVTASIGYALAAQNDTGSPFDLLGRADSAMYRAKNTGGDRVASEGGAVS